MEGCSPAQGGSSQGRGWGPTCPAAPDPRTRCTRIWLDFYLSDIEPILYQSKSQHRQRKDDTSAEFEAQNAAQKLPGKSKKLVNDSVKSFAETKLQKFESKNYPQQIPPVGKSKIKAHIFLAPLR